MRSLTYVQQQYGSLIHTEWTVELTTCCKITSLRSTFNTYPFHGANSFQSFESVCCWRVLRVYKVVSSYKMSTILRQSRRVGLRSGFKLTEIFLTVRKTNSRQGTDSSNVWPLLSSVLPLLQQIYESKYHINKIELQYCNLQT